MTKYHLYILKCSDRTLYAGITTNLNRRLREHNGTNLGAKYTTGRRPVKLVYHQKFASRSEASKAEAGIKKLSRRDKLAIIRLNKLYVKDNQSAK